jgi:hypothetical protein
MAPDDPVSVGPDTEQGEPRQGNGLDIETARSVAGEKHLDGGVFVVVQRAGLVTIHTNRHVRMDALHRFGDATPFERGSQHGMALDRRGPGLLERIRV